MSKCYYITFWKLFLGILNNVILTFDVSFNDDLRCFERFELRASSLIQLWQKKQCPHHMRLLSDVIIMRLLSSFLSVSHVCLCDTVTLSFLFILIFITDIMGEDKIERAVKEFLKSMMWWEYGDANKKV